MTLSEAQKRAIKKYRQGNGYVKAREASNKSHMVRDEFTRLKHVLKAFDIK
jgi:hypothetical protein